MPGALEGIRILDITNYIAGPYASLLLADLGAEVTKIETPGKGDPFRTWDKEPKNYSPSFCALNRNKKSLTLDMKTPEGKEVFLRLARDADVIVENLRPGVVDRLGIGYDVVREMNPRIIYCSISAFGQDGPYRKRPGYDTIGQSLSGLLSVLTELDHPHGPGAAFSDHLGGIFGCYGVLAALAARERTGAGQKVETSLLESTICFLGLGMTQYLFSGEVPSMRSRIKTAGVYALVAGDGKPFVIHLSHPPKFWIGVTEVMGRPDFQTDERTQGPPRPGTELRLHLRDLQRGGTVGAPGPLAGGAASQGRPLRPHQQLRRGLRGSAGPVPGPADGGGPPRLRPVQTRAERPQPAGHPHHPPSQAAQARRAQRGNPHRAGIHSRRDPLLPGKKHRMRGAPRRNRPHP